MTPPHPTLPATDQARSLARALVAEARHAALSFIDPGTGAPGISRIAWGLAPDGGPVTLISALAGHHAALVAQPLCAVMLGEAPPKGDPLAHPRLMLRARAAFVAPGDPARRALRDRWLADHPKAALYVDFADFAFVRLEPLSALLNAGFARAFRLTAEDLTG
jgi:putative heme iron utilization protein